MVPKGYSGLTLYPFIFLKSKSLQKQTILINHEKIHLKQQIEMLVIPFYICYFFEFLIRFVRYRNWQKAYRNISFEREAYTNENDLDYLKHRSFWSFLKYICGHDI